MTRQQQLVLGGFLSGQGMNASLARALTLSVRMEGGLGARRSSTAMG